jgi:flagellar basal-body rod modification protein FlgD
MSGISSATNSTSTSSTTGSQSSLDKLTSDFNNFLQLLTIQLQNQDPTEPMDTDKMTQQLVQFTGVEQQIKMNQSLDSLVGLQRETRTGAALSYIGKEVEYEGNELILNQQGGTSVFSYELPQEAEAVEVRIYDSTGQEVRAVVGPSDVGEHLIAWDGKDQNGNELPAGAYSVTVKALDGANEDIKTTTHMRGLVDGVQIDGTTAILNIGPLSLPMDEVDRIHLAYDYSFDDGEEQTGEEAA